MLHDIPDEMKAYPQWVMWRYEETDGVKPTKVPYNANNGKHANVNVPGTWCSFDQALHTLENLPQFYSGIGFVLTETDPYLFIDLDAPMSTDQGEIDSVMDRQRTVYEEFDSYAELSPSGKGLHIIIKGEIPSGKKRSSIEIYSSQRFMTMTGNVYRPTPIREYNELINSLWEQMENHKPKAANGIMGFEAETSTDAQIIEWSTNAANGEKFNELFVNGNWKRYYESQSEGDFALVNIIAFYSTSRIQVQRIFLLSKLAEREKSRAQYRIDYMLNRCFDRKLPPIDLSQLKHGILAALANQHKNVVMTEAPVIKELSYSFDKPKTNPYTLPPGIMGMVAQYIFSQSPRAVPEISLGAAMGLMSGICGRAYNVSGSGLNQYVLVLAPTGTGKETIHSGIAKLMNAVKLNVPSVFDFLGPSDISSAPALAKYLANTSPRFVSIVGEMGLSLKSMSGPKAPPHLTLLRRIYLELYGRSGSGSVLQPTIYSDKDKNTAPVLSPAFSIIGESTPERFYEVLDEDMVTEGFLPRLTLIEYNGPRPAANHEANKVVPSEMTIRALSDLCTNCLALDSQNQVLNVAMDDEATDIFRQLDKFCDDRINAASREVRRNLWTRVNLKAMRLAALVAVGCHPYKPEINAESAMWAINIILNDIYNLLDKFDAGDVGSNSEETSQMVKACGVIGDYVIRSWESIEKYKTGTELQHREKVVPYSYIYKRLSQVNSFNKSKMGTTFAIANTIKTLIQRGDLIELPRLDSKTKFHTSGILYIVSNPSAFGI